MIVNKSAAKTAEDTITRDEFENFTKCSLEYREQSSKKINSIHTALFAETADNEHGQPGLMHTARRIEQHIDYVCTVAKWVRAAVIAVATTVTALVGAAHAIGWL